MICPKCGFEVGNHAFCPSCGEKMPEHTQPGQAQVITAPNAASNPYERQNPYTQSPQIPPQAIQPPTAPSQGAYPHPARAAYPPERAKKSSGALSVVIAVIICVIIAAGIGVCIFSAIGYNKSFLEVFISSDSGIYSDYSLDDDIRFSDGKVRAVGEEYGVENGVICLKDVKKSNLRANAEGDYVYEFVIEVTNLTDEAMNYYEPVLYSYYYKESAVDWLDSAYLITSDYSNSDQASDSNYSFSVLPGETAELRLYYSGPEITSGFAVELEINDEDYTAISSYYLVNAENIK